MSNKERLLSQIQNVRSYINNSDIEMQQSFVQRLSGVEDAINGFCVYLPLVGGFNAGKSSLINSYLGANELLPTNIIPETAVATELYFGSSEKIEAYKFDEQTPIQTVNSLDFTKIDQSATDYLKVYINSPQLQKHNVILVDMPGLDSNLQRHNRSILGYMAKKVSFVLVLNIEDGTVRNSTLEFLKEIKDHRLGFFTVLNKTDKKSPDEITEIKEHIKQQLTPITENPRIALASAIDDQIDEFREIIDGIDIDEFIQKLFDDKSKETIKSIIFDLRTRRDAISLDVSDIDNKISDLLSKTREIIKEFDVERQKVENKFSQTLLADTLRDVENVLRLNINTLIEAINTSNESLNARINDLIRPLVASKIKNYSETIFTETIRNIEIKTDNMLESVVGAVDVAHKGISVAKMVIPLLPITFGGVITTVLTKINPIVAVVSAVVGIVLSNFGESKQEKAAREELDRQNQIRQHLQNVVIPSIPAQIAPSIQNSLDEIKDNFFAELKQKFDEKTQDIQNSLKIAKQEKESKKNEIESHKEKYTTLINQLKSEIGE